MLITGHEIGFTTEAQMCDRPDCTAEQLLFVFTLNLSHIGIGRCFIPKDTFC